MKGGLELYGNLLYNEVVIKKEFIMATTRRQDGATTKDARLDIRITPVQKDLVERAAAVSGLSMTNFVSRCIEKAAKRTLQDHEEMTLTRRDSEAFVQALIEPPTPSRRLGRAARRYKENLSP
jgi:uncharacterized protein (DUF1778 family)